MLERKLHRVHAIPTEKSSLLYHNGTGWVMGDAKFGATHGAHPKPHHLYFTSDEEIKEGDWVRHTNNDIGRVTHISKGEYDMELLGGTPLVSGMRLVNARKVVATTNPDLWDMVGYERHKIPHQEPLNGIAKIPTDFIEAFIREQGIWEVELEMEEVEISCPDSIEGCEVYHIKQQLKLNSQGAVIVHKIKEKMYTFQQIEKFIDDWEIYNGDEDNSVLSFKEWFNKHYPH